MNKLSIDQRTQTLLKTLIEQYISEGAPVGSKSLAESSGLPLSPATIRHIMSELEAQGFLQSPHTSAGRVPTPKAYRFFVDRLITITPVEKTQLDELKRQLNPNQPATNLVKSASELLSHFTNLAGIVMLPKREKIVLRLVEFLPLSDQRILVILVYNTKDVENRIIQVDREYSRSELQEVANFLNQNYTGLSLATIREKLIQHMQSDKEHMDKIMEMAIDMASRTFESPKNDNDYFVSGEMNLFNIGQQDMEKLRELMEAFRYKRSIVTLLDRCLATSGIQLFIGEEMGRHELEACSIITAPYHLDDKIVGVLGVIGPTRMSYDKVIPVVDVTAKFLSMALKSAN